MYRFIVFNPELLFNFFFIFETYFSLSVVISAGCSTILVSLNTGHLAASFSLALVLHAGLMQASCG